MSLTSAQLLSLAILRVQDGQRLVHQHGTEFGITPEAAFFRLGGIALKPRGGLNTLRRYLKLGLIVRAAEQRGYSGQTEYGLSVEAVGRFESDPDWQLAERVLREACAGVHGVQP